MKEVHPVGKDSFKKFTELFTPAEFETALQSYKGTAQYAAAMRYYQGCLGAVATGSELEPLGLLREQLSSMLPQTRSQRSTDGQGARMGEVRGALESMGRQLDEYALRKLRSDAIATLEAEPIPKKMHFVWVGGGLGDIQRDYINVWKTVMSAQGFTLNLWFDQDALLAYKTNQIIVAAAKADVLSSMTTPITDGEELADLYVSRALVLKQQMFDHITAWRAAGKTADEARIDLLVKAYGQDLDELRTLKKNNERSIRRLADEQLDLRDLSSQEQTLPLADIYEREISLRMNMAAASDAVRYPVEYLEGGIYCDVDHLPPFADDIAGVAVNALGSDARLGVLQLLLEHNPQWMPGRAQNVEHYRDYSDQVPPQYRAALEQYAAGKPALNEVFVAPGNLGVPLDGVRTSILRGSLSNAFLMAHPRSAVVKAIIDRIGLQYAMMDTAVQQFAGKRVAIGKAEADHFFDLAGELVEQVLESLPLSENERVLDLHYAKAIVEYFFDGIKPESDAAIFMTGPNVMRAGMDAYEGAQFTPQGASVWRDLVAYPKGVNTVTEEEQDHSWKEQLTDVAEWYAREMQSWAEGQYTIRYNGNVNELLNPRTLNFENGWPLIEGRQVLSTEILQQLRDSLGEPFSQAMAQGLTGAVTFRKDLSLSFDRRQQILAAPSSLVPTPWQEDKRIQALTFDQLLDNIGNNQVSLEQLNPAQRMFLGGVFGSDSLDSQSFGDHWPVIKVQCAAMADLSVANRYAAIERLLLKNNAAAFAEGLASESAYAPAYSDRSLLMKKASLQQAATLREWGARVARLRKVALAEYRDQLLTRQSDVLGHFGGSVKLAPQDLLLNGYGERIGGRCVPLVLVLAAALHNKGDSSNNLWTRFFEAAASPDSIETRAFVQSLEALQDVPLHAVGKSLGRVTLDAAIRALESESPWRTLMLNTDNHSMLLARTRQNGRNAYHFYDPNFAISTYQDPVELKEMLEGFFTGEKMADFYAAFTEDNQLAFDLIDIDAKRVSQWPLSPEMNVSTLLGAEPLPGEPLIKLMERLGRTRGRSLSESPRLGKSLLELDGNWWAEQIRDVSRQLQQSNGLSADYVPIYETLEQHSTGDYSISLIDIKDRQTIKRVTTSNRWLARIKAFLTKMFRSLAGKNTEATTPGELGVEHVSAVHTLNAGFTLQALINALHRHEEGASAGNEAPLAMSVRLHGYVNYAQMAHGTVLDGVGLLRLVQQGMAEERLIAATAVSATRAAVARVATEGVGAALALINVGFDIYQLAYAKSDVERAQVGTQLFFDATGGAMMVAGWAVGSSAGAILSGAGVIVAGLGVGVAALARGFSDIAEQAKLVGLYFHALEKTYREGGYQRGALDGVLTPKPLIVFKRIDFKTGQIDYGSPALFPLRDHFGVPDFEPDYGAAIDIRRGLGLPSNATLTFEPADRLVLPCTPATYFGYEYKALFGATNRHDLGFDLVRKLEQRNAAGNWQFMFTFWSFPGEYILYKMNPVYRATTIAVRLDAVERTLIVPQVPELWHGLITYQISAEHGRCAVVLNPGVSLVCEAAGNGSMHWELVAPWAGESEVKMQAHGQLSIGTVNMQFTGGHHDVLLRLKDDQVLRVDWRQQLLLVEEADALEVPGTDSLKEHFAALSREHRLIHPYTLVRNYQIPFEPIDRPVYTNAYYDAVRERFMYVRDIDEPLVDEAVLGAVNGDQAFFYHSDAYMVWQVDTVTSLPVRRYRLLLADNSRITGCLVMENGAVQVSQIFNRNGQVDELTYMIHEDQCLLTSITGDLDPQVNIALNAASVLKDWNDVLAPYAPLPYRSSLKNTVDCKPASLVSICWRAPGVVSQYAWVRNDDGLIIRPDIAPIPSGHIPNGGIQSRHLSLILAEGTEQLVFVFYDHSTRCLFRQTEATAPAIARPGEFSATAIEPREVSQVVATEQGFMAVTSEGLSLHLTTDGTLQLAGVTDAWLKERHDWWLELPALSKQYAVANFAILGVRNFAGDNRLGAWQLDGQLLLTQAGHGQAYRLLSVTDDKQAAWVFDPTAGGVYRQPFVAPERLREIFAQGHQVLQRDAVPQAQRFWSDWPFREVRAEVAGLRATTIDGVVLALHENQPAMVVGVEADWVNHHKDDLQQNLRALVSAHHASAFLSVAEVDSFQWYVTEADRLISVARKQVMEPFDLLGTHQQNNVLLVDGHDGRVHTFPAGSASMPLMFVQRHEDVLSVSAQGRIDDVLKLLPDGVSTLVLGMGQGAITCHLSKAAWERLDTVIVDCRRSSQSAQWVPGKLIWDLESPQKLLPSLFGEHLILIDPDSGHSLIFRGINAIDSELRAQVFLGLKGLTSFAVNNLVDRLAARQSDEGGQSLGAFLEQAQSPQIAA
ncbi:TcdA/TcdB pore-forming domain-containing protein [Pseudomonas baetica]|nr:TcdA/TcdB pore-forming domain-containing protein [Pseudomonas baetica]MDR9861780.1 TcdA/TcdB pore-forming domain-containing protein [Pseudomonas baetica]